MAIVDITQAPSSQAYLVGYVQASQGYEICTNVSFFGRDPNGNYEDASSDLFIVGQRPGPQAFDLSLPSPVSTGPTLPYSSSAGFIVFSRTGSSVSRGLFSLSSPSTAGMDFGRGANEIVVTPPTMAVPDVSWYKAFIPIVDSSGWYPGTSYAQLFGAMASIENIGVGGGVSYTDGGAGINALSSSPIRYHAPVIQNQPYVGAVVPIGVASAVPPQAPFGVVDLGLHPNYVAWLVGSSWDPDSHYGVAVLDAETLDTSPTPVSHMGYSNSTPLSSVSIQEPLLRRPKWGYGNDGCRAHLFIPMKNNALNWRAGVLPLSVNRPSMTSPIQVSPVTRSYEPPDGSLPLENVKRRLASFNPPFSLQPGLLGSCFSLTDMALLPLDTGPVGGRGGESMNSGSSRRPLSLAIRPRPVFRCPPRPITALGTRRRRCQTMQPSSRGLLPVTLAAPECRTRQS